MVECGETDPVGGRSSGQRRRQILGGLHRVGRIRTLVKGRCFPLASQVFLHAAHFQADPPTCVSGETAGVGDGVRKTAVSPAAGDELSAVCCRAASQASSGVRGGAAVEQGPVA